MSENRHVDNTGEESRGVSATATLDLNDALTFKSIAAYRSTESRGLRDADNRPFLMLTTDVAGDSEQFSQELQLQYDSGPINAIAGLYHFDEDTFERASVLLSFPPSPQIIGSVLAGVINLFDKQYLIHGNASLGTPGYAEGFIARTQHWYVQLSAGF